MSLSPRDRFVPYLQTDSLWYKVCNVTSAGATMRAAPRRAPPGQGVHADH